MQGKRGSCTIEDQLQAAQACLGMLVGLCHNLALLVDQDTCRIWVRLRESCIIWKLHSCWQSLLRFARVGWPSAKVILKNLSKMVF